MRMNWMTIKMKECLEKRKKINHEVLKERKKKGKNGRFLDNLGGWGTMRMQYTNNGING